MPEYIDREKLINEIRKIPRTKNPDLVQYSLVKWIVSGIETEDVVLRNNVRYKNMTTPFKNDPLSIVWIAFKNLFPEKDCECWFSPEINTDEEDKAYGFTDFCDDGSIVVTVDGNLTVQDATEILAHELAHVAVGVEHDHDDMWDNAFGMILEEYNRICEEMFSNKNS